MRILAAVAGVVTAVAALAGQEATFKAGNRTVAVYATVTGADGRLVPSLTRDAFSILDNGRRQNLTLFSSDLQPITVVMLLDRSGSMRGNFSLVQQAAEAFVEVMRPDDKARIGSFSNGIQVDPRDFTSDHERAAGHSAHGAPGGRADAALERGERGHHGAAAPAGPPRGARLHRRDGQSDELEPEQQLAQRRHEARRGRRRDGVRDRPRAIGRRWRRLRTPTVAGIPGAATAAVGDLAASAAADSAAAAVRARPRRPPIIPTKGWRRLPLSRAAAISS